MNAAQTARLAVRERDKLLRDAYHGRNGLSMTPEQRAEYKAMMDRVKEVRATYRRLYGR